MSDDAAWEIQKLIEQKREEIRSLLIARDAILVSMGKDPPEPEEEPRALSPKLDPEPAPDPKVAEARRKAIAKAAKKIGLDRKSTGVNGRRKFTADEKLAILEECERAPKKSAVLKKHSISYQSIANWKKAVLAGRLVPTALSEPEPPEEEEQEPDPFEEGKPLPTSFPLPQ